MTPLKNFISLRQAAKISGYNQDYLGYLIRTGHIKGAKAGRSYFTTEEEINKYILARKISQRKSIISDFFSKNRVKKIFVFSCVVLCCCLSLYLFSETERELSGSAKKNLSMEPEMLAVIKE